MDESEEEDTVSSSALRETDNQDDDDYDGTLRELQDYESCTFCFGATARESQWTTNQWNAVFDELMRSTSVENVTAMVKDCPLESLSLFVEYIRTSQKLNSLSLHYERFSQKDFDWTKIPKAYRSKIDDILHAVQQNPGIEKLELFCLGNPQSIRSVLSRSTSLMAFNLLVDCQNAACTAMAESIAAGLKANKYLKHVTLDVRRQGHLDIMLTGLCHRRMDDFQPTTLKSLSLWTDQPASNPELGMRVLEVIQCTPSLKSLVVENSLSQYEYGNNSRCIAQPWVDFLLTNLHHQDCTGLETIRLRNLTLGSGGRYDGEDTKTATIKQRNTTLKGLKLYNVTFHGEGSVRLLHNLTGLTQLHIDLVSYLNLALDDNESLGNEGQNGEENIDAGNWGQVVRQCADLVQVYVEVDCRMAISDQSNLMASLLNSARGHGALQDLTLKSPCRIDVPGWRVRLLLRQLLRETSCLKKLEIHLNISHHDFAAGLAEGLRGNNSLQKLSLWFRGDDLLEATTWITILESLLNNQTLQHLDNVWRHETFDSPELCWALARLFRVNKSLNHASLPGLYLREQMMRVLLDGLSNNSTLNCLTMEYCRMDGPGFALLRQALVDKKSVPMEHILLPRLLGEHSLSPDIEDFFHDIARMRQMKSVNFVDYSWRQNGEDCVKGMNLLLHAAQYNKYICSFGSILMDLDYMDEHIMLLQSKIDYYLKLNKFGRHLLDSACPHYIFPALLARMTTSERDDDTVSSLYFFIREFFLRNSYPLMRRNQQQQQHRPRESQPPQLKKARLGEQKNA